MGFLWLSSPGPFSAEIQDGGRVVFTMGKRYHCDFCDKTFAYSAQNRKKHVQGVQHQRNRKLHYDSFKGL